MDAANRFSLLATTIEEDYDDGGNGQGRDESSIHLDEDTNQQPGHTLPTQSGETSIVEPVQRKSNHHKGVL
jgi:hypothetical protein